MAKIAWLLISDLHLYYKNISTRVDYVQEMRKVREDLEKIAINYKSIGYEKVNMILLGDVFHRSYQNTFNTGYDTMFFVMWKEFLGDVFSLVGNHELHYYSSNPFFTLISEIESKKVQQIRSEVWTPQGLLPVIRVPDVVEDGEVVFHFNHYGTEIAKPIEGKVNIGLFHQELVDYQIVQEMEKELGGKVWARTKEFASFKGLEGYQYCFFGHMHKVYGVYKGGETYLYYLASLGRTSADEVNDAFLERCVPAVLTENGVLKEVAENKIWLPARSESVQEEVVVETREARERAKVVKAARNYEALSDSPVDGLQNYFAEDVISLKIIDGMLKEPLDEVGIALRAKFRRIVGD